MLLAVELFERILSWVGFDERCNAFIGYDLSDLSKN